MDFKPRLPEVIKNLFADTFVMGNELQLTEDTLPVLKLLRHVLPRLNELAQAEAWQLMQTRDYVGARQLLEEVDANGGGTANVKASLAACLFFQGDRLWNSYANEVRELPEDADAMRIVDSIEAVRAPF
jgi:thioredoxin-like negative regulator of GroEL